MAGGRLPHSCNSNPSSLVEKAVANQTREDGLRAADRGKGSTLNDEAGHTGKGGKLRLPRTALFRKKPYDRPVHSGALGFSSSLNGHTPSLRSRLVDSASNLIVSSASYLFDSFFKRRRTLWIDNGARSTARMTSADLECKESLKPFSDNLDKENVPALEGPALEASREKAEIEDLDLAKVEGILKQKLLSREEVKRLTEVLQNQSSGSLVVASNVDTDRRPEKIQQVAEELNPVELAKAYMGEHTSHTLSRTSRLQSTPYRYGEGAGPSSIKRIKEGVYDMSPNKGSKLRLASAERMLKRRLIADEDDNIISKGPARRVRQKMTIMPNSSPYLRRLTAGSGLRASSTSLLQFKESTEKVEEEPILPANGTSVEEPAAVVASNAEDPPESSKARENVEFLSKNDTLVLPMPSDENRSSSKAAVEPVVPITSKAAENSTIEFLVASPSEMPAAVPERSKGFHISAFFEDSSSDEESSPAVRTATPTEGQQQVGSSVSQGAPQENTQMQPFPYSTNDGSLPSAPKSTNKASLTLLQPSDATSPSKANFSSSPAGSSLAVQSSKDSFLRSLKPLPVVSYAPSATESELLPLTPSGSARAPSSVVLSTPPISASPSGPTTLPATSVSLSVQGAATTAALPSSSVAEVEKPSLIQKVAAAERVGVEVSGFSLSTTSLSGITRATEKPSLVAPSFTAPAAISKPSIAAVTTFSSILPGGSEPSTAAIPANEPFNFQASTGGAQVDTGATPESVLKDGGAISFMSASPGLDKQAEGDIMATDPMTEEPDGSFAPSSASPFLFGSASTAPTPMLSFGSNATSASPFSFPTPSSAPSGASSSAQFPFSSQSSSAAGQMFTFGSGTSPSNPFSVKTEASFPFGSSAASPIFTATSSAPVTFPATPAAPSFQFGASSSSTSSTSMFGAEMPQAAGAFAASGSQGSSSAFGFPAAPTSSGTPTPPSFQFGGAGASGPSFGGASSPSFGGQSFPFGGQPALTASNPFAQSGTSNAAPFQFGTSAAAPSQSVFPSGATISLPSPFGAQQPSGSPFSFTFGAQPGALPSGQPFSFGGQPAPPAQSPFSLPGATGQSAFPSAGASGMDFGGGFALGAAGGEKSGRKFIKAKRIGGGKRGK